MTQSRHIEAELEVDDHVIVSRRRKTVSIEMTAVLHNTSDDHLVVGSEDGDDVHCWRLFDAGDREIARSSCADPKTPRGATHAFRSVLVPSNLSIREQATLTVDASKLEDGQRYTVRHTHWGHTDEASFVAVHEPALAKAPRKKAAKKKRAPKKAAKKTAKRKGS